MASKLDQWLHAPCAFGPKGATEDICRQMTSSAARNESGCCRINCTSPLRKCRACLVQGSGELVVDAESGLCDFHSKHGADVRLPSRDYALSGDRPLDYSQMLTMKNIPESMRPKPKPVLVPEEERAPVRRTPTTRPKNRRRGVLPTCIMTYRDLETREKVDGPILDAAAIVSRLRKAEYPLQSIAKLMDVKQPTVSQLLWLERLEPEVRAHVCPTREPTDRIGLTVAVLLARMRPELQMPTAKSYLDGTLNHHDLEAMAVDPANRSIAA